MTDKSDVFHICRTIEYERKVETCQKNTGSYVELPSDPLMDTFYKMVHLLHDLGIKGQIRQWKQKNMMPNQEKIKLVYLYFISKPHKVIFQ